MIILVIILLQIFQKIDNQLKWKDPPLVFVTGYETERSDYSGYIYDINSKTKIGAMAKSIEYTKYCTVGNKVYVKIGKTTVRSIGRYCNTPVYGGQVQVFDRNTHGIKTLSCYCPTGRMIYDGNRYIFRRWRNFHKY